MPHYGYGMMGWDGGVWMIFHAAFWLLLLAGLAGVFLLPSRRNRRKDGDSSSALDVLDRRYAKGEIDRDDYLQRKEDILARAQRSSSGAD